jgi:hypothetical protein
VDLNQLIGSEFEATQVLQHLVAFLRKDKRDINQVIFDFASHQRSRDRQRLLQLLRGRELYVSIESSSVPLEHGRKFIVGAGDSIQLPTGTLPNGLSCVIFYVDRHDVRLGPKHAGLIASEAFEMVSRSDVDSLLIQNSRDSWMAFPREDLMAIRAKYLQ